MALAGTRIMGGRYAYYLLADSREGQLEEAEIGRTMPSTQPTYGDVFDPGSGEVRSDGPDGIACWFSDTDYNEESFFVRHASSWGPTSPTAPSRQP
jgi:hypothetical protein